MNDIHKIFLLEAIRMAEENVPSGKGGPFAAIVVRDGKVIGYGVNSVIAKNDPTAHAEIEAIRDACRNISSFQLTGCILYTSCEPCPMCFGAIYWARPKAVYFAASRSDAADAGFDDSFIYSEIDILPGQRKIPAFHILEKEGAKPFERWKEHPGKNLY
ncbi:MAG: nucleoside deaminase [Bacteroidetes bacterium]|nr:nucleoside deaminase [Bacteroidota bacterium]